MYRFFELLPGTLAWLTIFLIVIFSWRLPAAIAVFIILFDTYWLLKTIYLSLHLRSTFSAMKKNLAVNWLEKLEEMGGMWREVYHVIVFPMYLEPYEVVRESFESLARANYPKEKCIVVLAVEAQAGGARETAEKIKKEFGECFFRFLVTVHPENLPGEIPGKGSNETWALKEAKRLIIDPLIAQSEKSEFHPNDPNRKFNNSERSDAFVASDRLSYENILVSVFDIDTQIFPEYFGRLTYAFLNAPNQLRAIYQPIPLFTNNIYRAPALARVIAFSSTFWQMMQQARPERLTSFSSQSIPLPALLDVGYWHTDAVSEDSRIFWQGYLCYHGDFRVEPLHYPVSMDANAAPGFWQTMKNNYRQHRRWAWGAENIAYMFCGKQNPTGRSDKFVDSDYTEGFLYDKKIPLRKKWYWSFQVIEGFHSWATNSLMIFALGWLPVLLGGKHFNGSLLSYNLPQITRFIIELSMIGVMSSAIVSVILLPPRPEGFRWYHYSLYFLQWLLLPITLIGFGAFPAFEAQTRLMRGGSWRLGFWVTPKSRTH